MLPARGARESTNGPLGNASRMTYNASRMTHSLELSLLLLLLPR
jgi:hypothetical protein